MKTKQLLEDQIAELLFHTWDIMDNSSGASTMEWPSLDTCSPEFKAKFQAMAKTAIDCVPGYIQAFK